MNITAYAMRYKVVTLVIMTFILLGGSIAFKKLGRLEDPEFTIKEAVIQTSYPGANAEQVELEVTERIETAIQQLKQLKEVRSISRSGVSIIFAEIQETYDKDTLPQVWDELRRKVGHVSHLLPPGCGEPVVNDDFGDVYGVLFALTGNGYSQHALNEIAKDLRKELLLCTDVGRIDFWGRSQEVVYVEIDRVRLSQLGILPSAIFNTLRSENSLTETGKVVVGSEDLRLRVSGDYNDVSELENQLIPSGDGQMLRLKDIAQIKKGYWDPPSEILKWNGELAVGIGISTVSGGDVVEMGRSISKRIEELRSRIPVGIEIHSIAHQSETVEKAVNGFTLNLFAAVLIVVLLLIIFMGVREGMIVGIVLLLTILATFICMQVMGITLQRISLGALIIALGMLVDNAIVVIEGIIIKSSRGSSYSSAAEETVRDTQWPLLGATGIAILAFAAITLSKDMTGEWLKSLFQVVCISLGLSWVFAIAITPVLCEFLLSRNKKSKAVTYDSRFYTRYKAFLSLCVDHRFKSLAAVMALLVVAMWGFGHVRQDFMPDMNRPQITIDLWMPEHTHISKTEQEIDAVSEYVRGLDGVENVATFIGRGPLRFLLTFSPEMPSSAYAQLTIGLESFKHIAQLKAHLTDYLELNHPKAITSVDAFKLGPGGGAVVARLSGLDARVLRELSEKVKSIMRENPNARSIRTDWGNPVKSQSVNMAKARACELGVTRTEVANALAMNFSGVTAGVYRQGEDLFPIIMRPPSDQRLGIENINNLQIWSQNKKSWIPIDQVADGQDLDWETPVIHRLNRKRVLRVFCKQKTGTTDGLLQELRGPIEDMELPEGYSLEWGGEHEEQVEANEKLMANMPVAFITMLLISVFLFNSLRHPLIIFMGLPLSIIGVASGMLLADKPFGFMAMLGFLSLSGMLIKNEIVLLDQINHERSSGKFPYDAVIDAATSRIRPVCMASFTTVLGMIPLLRDAFFAPMAVTIIGGLTFATILTLIVVPVLYSTLFKINNRKTA